MTVDQFLAFFTGIYCDYDGAYGDQCFDLANAYSRWIGGQRFTGATADLIFNQPGDFYTQIPNTLSYVPQKGDIIIWNWPHVAIATGENSDVNQFEVLEQNDPLGSNCHIKIYPNYNGVIGALRPKQLPTDNLQSQLDEANKLKDQFYAELQDTLHQLSDCQNKVVSPTEIQATTNNGSTVVKVSTDTPQVPEVTESLQEAIEQAKPTLKIRFLQIWQDFIAYIKFIKIGK